jgi:hypothetical protein
MDTMIVIPQLVIQALMQRSLIGARATDPVVRDDR